VATDNTELWKQIDRLLRRRPRWRFLAVASPGAPPVWCFGLEHEPELSVTVMDGSISVYVAPANYDLSLNNAGELESWLTAFWPGALEERREKPGRGSIFRWE
jgi:hypothetical protein